MNTIVNTEIFCVQQVTNGALWGLTYLIICYRWLPILDYNE